MKVTLYMVSSMDGIVALGPDEDIHAYSSAEDRAFFLSRLKTHDAVITGRMSARHKVSLPRFVLTKSPERYAQYADARTTYLCGSPAEILGAVEARGFKNIALLGGPSTNTAFLKENLVDEFFLTIEPVLLGKGITLSGGNPLFVRWVLSGVRRLNEKGTLLLDYVRQR
ncbi:MAG: dihydrofolate reductase family protein [Treponema sp.]|nr:dihydrofolate reductase family protein [Treponema sp.]